METEELYRVIDLESVVALGSKPEQPFPRAWGDAQEALVDGAFMVQSDLYMVGRLVEQARACDDGVGRDLASALLGKHIGSSEDALQHEWFA